MLNYSWDELHRVWEAIKVVEPGTKVHKEMLEEVSIIIDIQDKIYSRVDTPWWKQIITSPVFISGAFQIGATILVINHERVGIITSKAFNWIRLNR